MKHKLFRLAFVLIFVIGLVMASTPQTARAAGPWYVSTTGNDANDCLSPASPCATINGAIGKASPGDTINVATGTYTGTGNEVVLLDKDATLSGGWDETFTTQGGMSTIDGQKARRGIMVNSGVSISLDHFIIKNGSFPGYGGGIYSDGNLTISNSSIHSNSIVPYCYGGGIFFNGNVLNIANTTVSNNLVGCNGAGIFSSQPSSTLNINNSTIKNNNIDGIYNNGTANLKNTIIAGNDIDCSGSAYTSQGNNIIGATLGCNITPTTSDQFNVDPLLGIFLIEQGYYPLLPGSPAINAADNTICPATDQRGTTRPQGITCDIGAYEYTTPGPAAILTVVNGSNQSGGTSSAFSNPLQAVVLDGQGTPVNGVTVTFTAPTSGASGTFLDTGTNTTSVNTDAGGVATTSTFTANNQAGTYNVSASANGLGSVNFSLEQVSRPPNDNFASAEVIPSMPFTATADVTNATNESNEPLPQNCYGMQNTIWYAFTPTETMVIRASLDGSAINSNLNIYIGSGVGISDLVFWACTSNGSTPSVFTAEAGQTYYFQAGSSYGDVGNVQINLEQIAPPENDNFANAELITLLPFSSTVDNGAASLEPDEPQQCSGTYNTVWYSFTPSETMMVQADTNGSTINGNINIYRASGSGITQLESITCTRYFSGVFLAEAGQTYYLQAGGQDPMVGNIQVNLRQITPPSNDDFDNAVTIDALPYSDNRDTSTATSGFDDPTSCHNSGSIWYKFTPTSDMVITANTIGSDYDTTIGVFTGVRGALNLVPGGCNDDYYGLQSRVSFSATGGTTYYFLLGRCCGSGGNGGGNLVLSINGAPAPMNNDFASAQVVTSLPFNATVNITSATTESNEPQYCYYSPNTVWYSFTPSANALVRADMTGSSFGDTIFNVYQSVNPGINGLSILQCAYYGNSATFNVQAGVTYYIQAGSISNNGGELHFNLQEIPRPANADFANATPVTSFPFNATPDVTNGGVEPNEPQNCYYMPDTVWYSFTPTVKTLVRANTQGSAINSNLNVYHDTGSGISGLSFVSNGCTVYYGTVTFIAEAGQTYYFQAGGIYGQVGTVQVNLEQIPLPVNDEFENAAIPASSLPFDNTVDTQYSTRQTGEPTPACAYYGSGTRSVWYAFTPTVSGSYSANIPTATFTPVLAVYTGNSLSNLSQIGCQPYGSFFTFRATAGTTYYFQVGNFYPWESGGSMQFHLGVAPQPIASFYTNPFDPSKYDTVQFQDNSYDPGNAGLQTYTWSFGDGTTATGYSAIHQYTADGDYQVTHTVTTTDGRTATITQTVQVRTHDVGITKIAVPNSANAGQTKTITVTLRNITYPETVQIDLYKSAANGFVFVDSVTISVPALSGNHTTAVSFSYAFTSDDARLGKVTFKAIATIVGARDAYPIDNEALSLITKVTK